MARYSIFKVAQTGRWGIQDHLMTQAMGHFVAEVEGIIRLKKDAQERCDGLNASEERRLERVAAFETWRATATPEELYEYQKHLD